MQILLGFLIATMIGMTGAGGGSLTVPVLVNDRLQCVTHRDAEQLAHMIRPADDANPQKGLVTREGIKLTFDDDKKEVTLETPGPSGANRATWAGGSGADCSAVPVRSSSWGRLKSLYRP